jgi:hypothetical protein
MFVDALLAFLPLASIFGLVIIVTAILEATIWRDR